MNIAHSPSVELDYPQLVSPPQNIILAGIQGAGKGTYGKKRLVPREKYDIYESSKMMQNSRFAQEVDEMIKGGILVPDEIPLTLISEYLDTRSSIANLLVNGSREQALRTIFDGMPRTLAQKKGIDELLDRKGREPAIAVKLEMSDEQALSNLRHRAVLEGRADDKEIQAIMRRMKGYHTNTVPVLDEYGEEGRLLVVDADPGIDLNTATEEETQAAFEIIYARLVNAINQRYHSVVMAVA